MAINFPTSPSNNQLFVAEGKAMRYVSSKGKWKQVSTLTSSQITDLEARTVGVSSMSISGNTLVIQKDDSSYANVSLAPFAGNKLTTYANASILPLSGLVSGTQVYVEDTDSLYITDGSGWYKIATVNLSPSLTLGVESISLGSGDSVDVNYTVNEPEDTPYTVSASATSNATITVYQANNTITFSAPVQDSTETITITATDGVNSVGDTLTMTITFTFDWSTATQEANIQTNVTSGAPQFGHSVDLDNNGDTMIAGAKGDTTQANDSAGNNKGTLSIYTRSGSTWSRQQKITNPYNSSGSDQFGSSSAISGDGNTVIVGTPFFYDSNTSTTPGIASVYSKSGSTWNLSKSLTSGNTQNDQWYGASVDVDNDATRIVVGAPRFNVSESSGSKTDAGYAFVYKNNGSKYYDISVGATSTSNRFSVASQETAANALDFSSDGTKLFIVGSGNDTIFQYTLSTAWDITTASYDNVSFSISSQLTIPRGIRLISNGSKLLVVGYTGTTAAIFEYDLSTANDLSTASYNNVSFNVANEDLFANEIEFNSDGTIMIMLGIANDKVYEYSLSTAYDISSASYNNVDFSISSEDGNAKGLAFNSDGTKMFICGSTNDKVFQYSLSTAYDISTASYDNIFMSTSPWQSAPTSIRFNNNGSELYVLGTGFDGIYAFSTVGLDVQQEAQIYADDYMTIGTNPEVFGSIAINSTGDTIVAGGAPASANGISGSGIAYIFKRNTQIDFTTATHDHTSTFSRVDQETNAMLFNDDGTKMYLCGGINDKLYTFNLSTAYDVTTAVHDSSADDSLSDLAVGGDTSIRTAGMRWNDDGTKLFILNQLRDRLHEYALSTAYDVTTMSHTGYHTFLTTSLNPHGFDFNNDGTKIFVTDRGGDTVYSYNLTSAYDVSTISTEQSSFTDNTNMNDPFGVSFNGSGTQMFITNIDTFATVGSIKTYNLSTAYDITTATFSSSTSLTSGTLNIGEGQPKQITFNSDYTKAYLVGNTLDMVSRFSVGQAEAWNQEARIMPSAVAAGDDYGNDVDISDDGNTVVVGSMYDGNDNGIFAGAAYVWTRSGSTWSEAGTLTASDGEAYAQFGHGVAISGTGDTIVIGSNKFNSGTGKAYVFQLSSGTWSQTKILTASDAASSSEFGWQTALNQNGSTGAVSAVETDNGASTQAGSVYIYKAS